MSTISQIVALHRRAAQEARTPHAAAGQATPAPVSATVTLGAVRAPVTYNTRIRRTAPTGSIAAEKAEETQDSAAPPAPASAEAARWWDDTPHQSPDTPPLDATA